MSYALYCRLNVHVRRSDYDVIRMIRNKLKRKHRTARRWRADRHRIYRAVLKEHHDARALFQKYRF